MLYVTRLHIFDEDWKKNNLKGPGKEKVRKAELLAGGEECKALYSNLFRALQREPVMAVDFLQGGP